MFGSEYFFNQVDSREAIDSFFHGGEILPAYMLTGEVRPYNERAGIFEAIFPSQSVFKGGKFQRITPMLNWHLSDNARMQLSL